MRGNADLGKPIHAIAVEINAGICRRNALEQTEQKGADRDVRGRPVAEDHDCESKEAEARDLTGRRAVCRRERIDKAADAGQRARDGRARIAHLVDIDAERCRRLRIFAAGAQTQTELGGVQQHRQHDEEQNADIGRKIDLVDQQLAEEADVLALRNAERALLNHKPGGCAAVDDQFVLLGDDVDEEEDQRGRQQVERRAADGLIRL